MMKSTLSGFAKVNLTYPANIGRGYYANYLLEEGLSPREREDRKVWLDHLFKHQKLFDFINTHINHTELEFAFEDTVSKHGIFYGRFFDLFIGTQLITILKSDFLDRRQLETYMSEFWNRPIDSTRKDDLYVQTKSRLKDLYVLKLLNDPVRYKKLCDWFRKASENRKCVLCEDQFAPINLPPSIYFGSNGQTTICFNCPIVEKPVKQDLKKLVPAFVTSCGFIPPDSATPTSFHFMSRTMAGQLPEVLTNYARIGGIKHVKKKFGSWFEALAETGALPEGTLYTARGVKCLANDGHVCNSLDERLIDDWLHAHQIPHTKEPYYPKHPTLNPKGLRRSDWLVGECYIEYFGLIGDEAYDKKVNEKLLLCATLGLKILALYPNDLANLDHKIKRALIS